MSNVVRIGLAAAGLVLLAGCEKDVPRTDYMPLRDGNRWEYRLLDNPLLKRMAEGQEIQAGPQVPQVGADADQTPPKAALVDESTPKADSAPPTARRVALELRGELDDLTYKALYDTAEQVWSKKAGYIGFQSARGRSYLLILPPHTGYKWVVSSKAGEDLFYEIESARATIATPAGTFENCALARQESRDRKEVFRYWFAPDVGLVRRSKYFVGEEVFRQELIEYAVKPATPGARMAEAREVQKAGEKGNRGSEFRDRGHPTLPDLDSQKPDLIDERIREYGHP